MRKPSRSIALLVVVTCGWCVDSLSAAGPVQAPFRTLLPWSPEHHEWEIAAGIDYRSGAYPPFYGSVDKTQRDEWHLQLVDAAYGLGSGGEARLQFGLQSFEEEGGLQKTGIEDARLSFAYEITSSDRFTVTGALDVKLPNASGEERLGTDQTDVRLSASLGHRKKRWGWAAEAGLGILGNPGKSGSQDDVFVFGGAGWWAMDDTTLRVIGEIEGIAGSRFDNNTQTAGAGIVIGRTAPVSFVFRHGLTDDSPDWSAAITVTFVRPVTLTTP